MVVWRSDGGDLHIYGDLQGAGRGPLGRMVGNRMGVFSRAPGGAHLRGGGAARREVLRELPRLVLVRRRVVAPAWHFKRNKSKLSLVRPYTAC